MDPELKKNRRGIILVFTGNGKGKSTAAMGLALRAAGNRMPVRIVQFIKGSWKTGERTAFTDPYLTNTTIRALPGTPTR